MRIAIDAMGGDFAPLEPVRGALLAREQDPRLAPILVGREDAIRDALREMGLDAPPAGVSVRHAEEVVEIADDPATAFRKKPHSSLTVGLELLRDGEADGFVSAGSTGALLAGATLVVKRIRGVRRAALAPVIPTAVGRAVLLDCGANAECTTEYLLQFAHLGSYYAQRVLGLDSPRVGLLNIGAEPEKGDALRKEAYQALRAANGLNFIGNVEAKEAMLGACDVIVADGFSGNIMLKSVEGAGAMLSELLRGMLSHGMGTRLAAALLRGELKIFKKTFDPNEVGGTALLGIAKPVVKAHGASRALAFCNALRQAAEVAQSGIAEAIAREIAKTASTHSRT